MMKITKSKEETRWGMKNVEEEREREEMMSVYELINGFETMFSRLGSVSCNVAEDERGVVGRSSLEMVLASKTGDLKHS